MRTRLEDGVTRSLQNFTLVVDLLTGAYWKLNDWLGLTCGLSNYDDSVGLSLASLAALWLRP